MEAYNDLETTQIWKDYENGRAYQSAKGMPNDIAKYVAFYEFDHWSKETQATKHMPRPVINASKMIVDNKVSNICGSPVKINYVAENNKVATSQFTRFAHYISKEMGMGNLDFEAVLTGCIKGTFVKHYYHSEEAIGRKGRFEGGLRCELIDVLNFFVADPNEKDIQKQEWLMLALRQSVKKVKEMCDTEERKKLIEPDDLDTYYPKKIEMNDSNQTTLLIQYFKKDGEVYFQKATKSTIVHDPKPLNPYLLKKIKAEEKDGQGTSTPDEVLEKVDKEWREDYYMATKYPIEIVSLQPSNDCIYGISEIKGLVVVQKLINFNVAMGGLNLQEQGAPKTLVKPMALQGQVITNEPGQILVDYSPGDGWGIKNLEARPFTAQALEFAPALLNLIRNVSNASEIITGDMISKDLSGYAIAQLQQQSLKPIEMQRKRFWQHKEREGKILEMFMKLYYEEKEFTFDYSPIERISFYQSTGNVLSKEGKDTFNGEAYQDIGFNIVVEAGAGSQYNELLAMSMLDNLLSNKHIDLKTYVELYPESGMPFKEQLKEFIFMQEQTELSKLRELSQQQAIQLEQLNGQAQQYDQAIRQISSELNKSKTLNGKLQQEYAEKLTSLMSYINGQTTLNKHS